MLSIISLYQPKYAFYHYHNFFEWMDYFSHGLHTRHSYIGQNNVNEHVMSSCLLSILFIDELLSILLSYLMASYIATFRQQFSQTFNFVSHKTFYTYVRRHII